MSQIQAVIFNKQYFTHKTASNWLNKQKIKPIKKYHETQNYYRYRIREPNNFSKFRLISHKPGVKFVIGFK
jgi:hypothetical protein